MAEAVLGRDPADLLARGISEEGALAYGEPDPEYRLGGFRCGGRARLGPGHAARGVERYIDQGHESASWVVRAQLAEIEFAQVGGTAPPNMPSMRTRS